MFVILLVKENEELKASIEFLEKENDQIKRLANFRETEVKRSNEKNNTKKNTQIHKYT